MPFPLKPVVGKQISTRLENSIAKNSSAGACRHKKIKVEIFGIFLTDGRPAPRATSLSFNQFNLLNVVYYHHHHHHRHHPRRQHHTVSPWSEHIRPSSGCALFLFLFFCEKSF